MDVVLDLDDLVLDNIEDGVIEDDVLAVVEDEVLGMEDRGRRPRCREPFSSSITSRTSSSRFFTPKTIEVRASVQVLSRTTSSSRTRSWISDPLDRGPFPRCQGLEVEDHVRVFVLVLDIEDDVLGPRSL